MGGGHLLGRELSALEIVLRVSIPRRHRVVDKLLGGAVLETVHPSGALQVLHLIAQSRAITETVERILPMMNELLALENIVSDPHGLGNTTFCISVVDVQRFSCDTRERRPYRTASLAINALLALALLDDPVGVSLYVLLGMVESSR